VNGRIRVLVTDPSYKHALGIVRCLGRRGMDVFVASPDPGRTLAGSSRWCRGTFSTAPIDDAEAFVEDIAGVLEKESFDVFLPVGLTAHRLASRFRERLSRYAKVPVVDFDKFSLAADKGRTAELAREIGLHVPWTLEATTKEALDSVNDYPVVVKAREAFDSVAYALDRDELDAAVVRISKRVRKGEGPPIVQEYVPGSNGYGFFALYWEGRLVVSYMHRRLRMYPRSGGASTYAAVCRREDLREHGKRLLDALQWHGVAMVEFKEHERNGKLYLMEVNPKYWGSLELGIAAGCEIPYYHVMQALGRPPTPCEAAQGTRFWWPDFDLLRAVNGPHPLKEMAQWAGMFVNPAVHRSLSLSDPAPAIVQAVYAFRHRKSLRSRR